MADYPKREAYFAHKFVRLMLRCCAAQEIGADGFALAAAIVHTEDAKRYTGAVTYWNEQLMPILGFTFWKQLDRARQKSIDAGWLHYESGGKRKVGRYWVTIPADIIDRTDSDVSCSMNEIDHKAEINRGQSGDNREINRGQSVGNPLGEPTIKRLQSVGESVEHSSLPLSRSLPLSLSQEEEKSTPVGVSPVSAKARPPKFSPSDCEIPAEIDTPAFRDAWQTWIDHRREIRKPLTPTAAKQCLAKCAEIGESRALAAIRHSAGNGWTGLFEPDAAAAKKALGYDPDPRGTFAVGAAWLAKQNALDALDAQRAMEANEYGE